MKYLQTGKAKLVGLGIWVAQDPRRLTVILTLVIAFATVLALTTGLAPLGTLVGPASDGGSGGG